MKEGGMSGGISMDTEWKKKGEENENGNVKERENEKME